MVKGCKDEDEKACKNTWLIGPGVGRIFRK